MRGVDKLSYDFGKINAGLKKDRLGKAVKQLAKNIERVMLGTMPIDRVGEGKDPVIFPVIVVHDALYSAPGLNYWVHYWMEEELDKVKRTIGKDTYDRVKQYPVTVLEIDSLILYQQHLRRGELDLVGLLKGFNAEVQYGKRGFLTAMEADTYARKSVLPFAKFVADEVHRRKLVIDQRHIEAILIKYGIRQK